MTRLIDAPQMTAAAPPCDVCGKPGPFVTWGHNLCQSDADAIWAVLPTVGEIDAACGITNVAPLAEAIARSDAECLRRMRLWVAKRKAALKAHLEVVK
jgi:hypothetical protein